MKTLAKTTIAGMVGRLPWGARRTILETLIRQFSPENVFADFCRTPQMRGLTVVGENGFVEGPIGDRIVIWRYAARGTWASATVNLFREFFTPQTSGTFIDIGANVGLSLLPIAKLGTVACHAFEPEPENFRFLRRNVLTAGVSPRCQLHQVALFDKSGEIDFAVSALNAGAHRITAAADGLEDHHWRTIKVKAYSLDSYLQTEKLASPLGIKIDAEGGEAAILRGGRNMLSRAGLLIFEFSPSTIHRVGADGREFTRFLRDNFREATIYSDDAGITDIQFKNIEAPPRPKWSGS